MTRKEFLHDSKLHIADNNAGRIRRNLHVSKSSGVPELEYQAILTGIHKIIEETGRQLEIKSFGSRSFGTGPYSSPDKYQARALTRKDRGFGRQVSAYALDTLLRAEPWQAQNPHFDFMVIEKDLRTSEEDTKNNFLFGYGPYPNNIISVKRFIEGIPNQDLRLASLAILAAHEVAHNLDLVWRTFNIGSTGYQIKHCLGQKGSCLMEQVNVAGCRRIQEQAKLILPNLNWLCTDCTDEIDFKKKDLRRVGVYW